MNNFITEKFLSNWLDKLSAYWKRKNVDGAVDLFKKCKFYQESPFHKIAKTAKQIRELWFAIRDQSNVELFFNILTISGKTATINYHASFNENGKFHVSDGIYFIEFDDKLDCVRFMQWFMVK